MSEDSGPGISIIKRAEYAALVACFVLMGVLYIGKVPALAQTSSGSVSSPNTISTSPSQFGLTAVPHACGTGKITLRWNALPDARSYMLFRDGTNNKIYENRNTLHEDSGLAHGSVHTYMLAVLFETWSSPQSVSVTAPPACATDTAGTTTAPPPPPPTETNSVSPTPPPPPPASTTTGNTTQTGTSQHTSTTTTSSTQTTTQQPTQSASLGLTAQAASACGVMQVALSWTRAVDGAVYEVYRNEALALSTAAQNFVDVNVVPDTLYAYKVIALNSGRPVAYALASAKTAKKCESSTSQPPMTSLPTMSNTSSFTPPPPPAVVPYVPPTTGTQSSTREPQKQLPPIEQQRPLPTTTYQQRVQSRTESALPRIASVPPSAIVVSMQTVAETISTAQSALEGTRSELITSIETHIERVLSDVNPETRVQAESAVRAIRDELIEDVRSSLDGIASARPDVLTGLSTDIEAGFKRIDALANRSVADGAPGGDPRVISDSIRTLSETIAGASDALRSSGGDALYKDTNNDGISDYDSVRIYGIDPIAPSPVTVLGTTTLTAGEKVLLGYDPRRAELVKVIPEEPRASLAPETSVYAVKEVELTPEKRVTIRGTALPNSFVTVYVYSTPIIVTVKTNGAGQWEYTVDKELETGEHTIYAATVDNTGKIVAKSIAIPFTQTAEAATLDIAPIGITTGEKPSLFNNPALIPLFILSIIFLLGALYVMGRSFGTKSTTPPQV